MKPPFGWRIGKTYHDLGDFSSSKAHYGAAYEILRNQPRGSDEARIEAMSEVGHLLTHLKQYEQAEAGILKSIDEARALLGSNHRVTLSATGILADLRLAQGRLSDSEALYRSLIKQSSLAMGEKAVTTLTFIHNLGVLLLKESKYAEAEILLRECSTLRAEIHGPEHPITLAVLSNLAGVLTKLNRFDESETILRKCLEAQRRVLGEEHPYTIGTTGRLGSLMLSRGHSMKRKACSAGRCRYSSAPSGPITPTP